MNRWQVEEYFFLQFMKPLIEMAAKDQENPKPELTEEEKMKELVALIKKIEKEKQKTRLKG